MRVLEINYYSYYNICKNKLNHVNLESEAKKTKITQVGYQINTLAVIRRNINLPADANSLNTNPLNQQLQLITQIHLIPISQPLQFSPCMTNFHLNSRT